MIGRPSSWLSRCSSRRHPRGGCPAPCVRMQLFFSQKRSSLKRFQTVPFSTCRTNFASHFLNWITSGSTIDGSAYPPEPMRRQSISSPLSTSVMLPTIEPRFSANTCSSSRSTESATSRSSRIGSDSSCVSKVFSFVPATVCFAL